MCALDQVGPTLVGTLPSLPSLPSIPGDVAVEECEEVGVDIAGAIDIIHQVVVTLHTLVSPE